MMSSLRRVVKNTACNYSSVKVKAREATSNDQALPSAGELNFLAAATYDSLRFVEVMCVIWKRLCDSPKCWRHVYKSLLVLEHLLVYGNPSVIEQSRCNMYILKRLENFQLYEGSVDHGLVVRDIVARIVTLLNEPDTLKARREKALAGLKKRRGTARASVSSTHQQSTAQVANARREERERRPSQILESAPKTTEDEEHQLQLALALSCPAQLLTPASAALWASAPPPSTYVNSPTPPTWTPAPASLWASAPPAFSASYAPSMAPTPTSVYPSKPQPPLIAVGASPAPFSLWSPTPPPPSPAKEAQTWREFAFLNFGL